MPIPERWRRLGAVFGSVTVLSVSMATPAVAVAQDSGPEILVKDVVGTEEVAPDSVFSYQPIVHNSGDAPAVVIGLDLFDDYYAHHVQRFSNCRYNEDDDGTSGAYCEFAIDLAPGETAQVPADSAVELHVLPNAPHGLRVNASYSANAYSGPVEGRDGEFGDGPELKLEKLPDANFGEGEVEFANVLFEIGANPADVAAVGAEIDGEVGDVVTVSVGIENHGPADIEESVPGEGADAPDRAVTTVAFPEGVTVTEVLQPEGDFRYVSSCVPIINGTPAWERHNEVAGSRYLCSASETPLGAGERWLFPFQVEITGEQDATGEVMASEGPNDPDPSNNTAEIVLRSGPGTGDSPGGGGGLPATGSATTLIAGTGAALLVAGIGLYLATRRRRVRLTTGEDAADA